MFMREPPNKMLYHLYRFLLEAFINSTKKPLWFYPQGFDLIFRD